MIKSAFALVALCVNPAGASNWVKAISSSDGTQLSIDLDSIVKNDQIAQAWVELDYSKVKSEPARKSVELWKFNCSDRTSFTACRIFYRADGSVMRSDNPVEVSYSYKPVAPDTYGEFVMTRACG